MAVAYSSILQDFIEPIRQTDDTGLMFFAKCQIGQGVWNLCIAREFNLPIENDLSEIFMGDDYRTQPGLKETVDLLIARKDLYFHQYKNLIITLEGRTKADGEKTIYVESIPGATLKQCTYP